MFLRITLLLVLIPNLALAFDNDPYNTNYQDQQFLERTTHNDLMLQNDINSLQQQQNFNYYNNNY